MVNYDFPNYIEDYVHRVGRTGRAGYAPQFITNDLCIVVGVCWCRRTGKALTFRTGNGQESSATYWPRLNRSGLGLH